MFSANKLKLTFTISLVSIFNGTLDYYMNSSKSHLRQTASKTQPSAKTIADITASTVWRMENELYEFAAQQFHFLYKLRTGGRQQRRDVVQKFFYEKIRPKK